MKKITLITGASSGLGKEFAKIYCKENNNLMLLGRNLESLNLVKEELTKINSSVDVEIYKINLLNLEELKSFKNFLEEHDYFVNNLVNCAGFGDRCDFKDMDLDKQIDMNRLNCDAILFFNKLVLNRMLENNEGHIINVSSIAGFIPGPYMSTYHATKSYILLLSESISFEVRKSRVKILALCPGPFESNFVKVAGNDYTFKKIKPMSAQKVAEKGYKASIKGKKVYIPGFGNKLTIFAAKLAPRCLIRAISAKNIKKDI